MFTSVYAMISQMLNTHSLLYNILQFLLVICSREAIKLISVPKLNLFGSRQSELGPHKQHINRSHGTQNHQFLFGLIWKLVLNWNVEQMCEHVKLVPSIMTAQKQRHKNRRPPTNDLQSWYLIHPGKAKQNSGQLTQFCQKLARGT